MLTWQLLKDKLHLIACSSSVSGMAIAKPTHLHNIHLSLSQSAVSGVSKPFYFRWSMLFSPWEPIAHAAHLPHQDPLGHALSSREGAAAHPVRAQGS